MPEGYSLQILDGDQYVVFTTDGDNLPFIRMRLEQGDVCADPEQHDISRGRSTYKLLNNAQMTGCYTNIAGTKIDTRFQKILSVREDRLYQDNGVYYLIMNLPKYPVGDSANYYWNLHTNSYFYWNPDCDDGDGFNKEYVLEELARSDGAKSTQSSLLIICVFNFAIIFGIEIIGIILTKSKDDIIHDLDGKNIIYETISFGLRFMFIGLMIWYFDYLTTKINEYTSIVSKISNIASSPNNLQVTPIFPVTHSLSLPCPLLT